MPTDGELIKKYVEIRDLLKTRDDAREMEDKPYKDAMLAIEGMMSIRLKERGDESVRTEWGTAYKQTSMSAKVADREMLFNFVRNTGNYDLLTAAVSKDAVKEYAETNAGEYPPGVDVTFFTKTLFRRS